MEKVDRGGVTREVSVPCVVRHLPLLLDITILHLRHGALRHEAHRVAQVTLRLWFPRRGYE